MIQSTCAERKQSLNHRLKVHPSPKFEVKSRGVTKQSNNYLPRQKPSIYHLPMQQKYIKRHFLDPSQTLTHQLEVMYPENIEMNFLEGQSDKEFETSSPYP